MIPKINILIIDDDPNVRNALVRLLREHDYIVSSAPNAKTALKMLSNNEYHIAIIDQKLPDMSGIELLKTIKQKYEHIECIIVTGYTSTELAVSAIKAGAYDYLEKPFKNAKLLLAIEHLKEKQSLITKINNLRNQSKRIINNPAFKDIITESKKMYDVFRQIEKIAGINEPVLICGESGTGKSLLAQSLHFLKYRNKKPFVTISEYNDEIIEKINKPQRGGTFYFREVGDMPIHLQIKILPIMKKYINKASFVFSTSNDIIQLIKSNRFRKDFYYYIASHIVEVPPLRARKEDISLLSRYIIQKYAEQTHQNISGINWEVIEMFKRYNWPGNVRELESVLKSAMDVETTTMIHKTSLPSYFQNLFSFSPIESIPTLEELERQHIQKVLSFAKGNKSRASKILNISRQSLIKKIRKYEEN